ncbi:Imm32 family immunity protein [Candidatus Endoriftia persephonae]|jgi:hypothetical protein|uniref:Uncharacterized protein n=1 Tax=Candidatus Endoriftia persephonae TaxID=393765 RepID=A0A9J6ZU92_9GAMM|nr:hypothetical protein [Candidatus Endoriftia persephone]USF86411.1 hypothetical protein L0Y14_09660 [Candidatus Endoriftia persephone]
MKIYGYKDEGLDIEQIVPAELAEITLVASPDELRMIASFLKTAAQEMERMGEAYDHEHLSDKNEPYFDNSPHFVVAREE